MTYLANITAAAAPYIPSMATVTATAKTAAAGTLAALTETTGLVAIAALTALAIAYLTYQAATLFNDFDLINTLKEGDVMGYSHTPPEPVIIRRDVFESARVSTSNPSSGIHSPGRATMDANKLGLLAALDGLT